MEDKPIVFEDWQQVLMTSWSPDRRRAYREAIVKFRYWLRQTGKLSDIETFKEHLSWKQSYLSPERFELRRAALRWYYSEGLKRMKAAAQKPPPPKPPRRDMGEFRTYVMNDVPTAGARDLGGPAWEQALVRRIRENNLAWTSEKTYRA